MINVNENSLTANGQGPTGQNTVKETQHQQKQTAVSASQKNSTEASKTFENGSANKGGTNSRASKHSQNGNSWGASDNSPAIQHAQQSAAPLQTFEKAPFKDLMNQYEGTLHQVQPTIELTQSLLMTQNLKEAANNISGLQFTGNGQKSAAATGNQKGSTASTSNIVNGSIGGDKVYSAPDSVNTGGSYFYKTDYIADLTKKCATKDIAQVSKILTNMGTSDKASNWLLEQRNLQRAQAREGRDVRDMVQTKIVDQLEYVRIKENIASAKQRAIDITENDDLSDSEATSMLKKTENENEQSCESETEEDSGQALKRKQINDKKIASIIRQIRQNAKLYLGSKDGQNYDKVPLTTICKKLRKDPNFMKKRDSKLISKNFDAELKKHTDQLEDELKQLKSKDNGNHDKKDIEQRVKQIESVLGLEKRMRTDNVDQTVMEIDMKPMNNQATDIQNILFDYCGINTANSGDVMGNGNFANQKRIEKLFGKIRKLPRKSCLLENFEEELYDPKKDNQNEKSNKRSHELVKVIGLEPDKLFEKIPKYKIQIGKMPQFSNVFDSVDSILPASMNKQSLVGQSIINPINHNMTFQRIDGRQVISLQFNPYFIQDDMEKKKIYEGYMREIIDQREKIKNAPKEAKNKQELQNIKRAWANIVKKDIPKAYRLYQKFKADQENNNKKLSQNCLKEVRKKAAKTQRLAKESVMRARKLTKEMAHYWRKRDKEMADSKRKREKMDKELKKRQQEEEEALLQKKRLEYLMQQSEIYAHFMATKLGVADDHKKGKEDLDQTGMTQKQQALMKKIDIDKRAARIHVAGMINENRKRLDEFDDHDRDEVNEEDLDDQKFNNPMGVSAKVEKPKMFRGDLKKYQLKGLQWLDNLYDQGINGILADEMGLGKTIQTIALLAHLAEKKNVWGPFLIIVPVTTLHNWQNELAKFCPELKVLPYFGSAEERKKLARFLDPKNMYNPVMGIHVLITSYNLIVGGGKDQLRLQRVKWHYMILDEAQAIKNNASRRWKTLLNFQTRNRLLLSGTPIQNSMAELWALLHFIMPKLFDNHEQFQEWFSKDIEQHSMDQGELNKHQLKRLHLILQPFMLRRLKKDVEQEIAPKIEEIVQCDMTHRQKVLYDRIKSKISASDLFQLASSKQKMENLMNLVMQFRKVCNHPDLFERRLGKIPFVFAKLQHGMLQNMSLVSKPDIVVGNQSPIEFVLPKMVFDECYFISDNSTNLFSQQRKGLDASFSNVSVETHFKFFNIFNPLNLHREIYCKPADQKTNWNCAYSIIALLSLSNNWSFSEISFQAVADKMVQTIALMHHFEQKSYRNAYLNIHNSDKKKLEIRYGSLYQDGTGFSKNRIIDIQIVNFVQRDDFSCLYKQTVKENLDLKIPGDWLIQEPVVPDHPRQFLKFSRQMYKNLNIYYDSCIAEPINIFCPSVNFFRHIQSVRNNPIGKKLMIGRQFKPKRDIFIGRVGRERTSFLKQDSSIATGSRLYSFNSGPPQGYELIEKGLLDHNFSIKGACTFQLPDYSRLVTDCSKMKILSDLLEKLHKGGHRCLIFCQMTRMMDILEDFLIWQKYTYFRMDGSTQLQDRRFMVEEFQTNPNIFVFILSTRAGGLGINLIAADTVIFYDNDWNPTMDSQATDRAHRIGQKKTVHVYRLVTKNTVEERILRRARQKENVQSTVYGANLKADSFSTRDVVDMIIDDIDDPLNNLGANRNQVKGFIKTPGAKQPPSKQKRGKKKKKGDNDPGAVYEVLRKVPAHKKYENEIDLLFKDADDDVKQEFKKQEEEANNSDQGMSDSDDNGTNSIDMSGAQSAFDKKRLLLQMLEKQAGGNVKQTFNFEDDDNVTTQVKGTGEEPIAKKQRGRPPRDRAAAQTASNGNIADEGDDDMGDDEDPDY